MFVSNNQFPILLSCLSFLVFAVYTYLGIYILYREPRYSLSRVFFCLSLAMGIWSLAYSFIYPQTDKQICLFWYKITSIGWISFASFVLHFFIILTQKNNKIRNWWTYLIVYIPPIIFAYPMLTGNLLLKDFGFNNFGVYEIHIKDGGWANFFTIYWLGYMAIGTYLVWRWGKKTEIKREKRQARLILYTVFLPIVGGLLTNRILPYYGAQFPTIAQILSLVWYIGVWYSIQKFKLMVLTPKIAAEEIILKIKDLLILANADGEILKVNGQVTKVLGFKESDLVGKHFSAMFENYDEVSGCVSKIDGNFGMKDGFELYCKTRMGKSIPVAISFTTINDELGDSLGKVIVIQDIRHITLLKMEIEERKQIEGKLIESNEKLKELDKLKTDFLSTVSHELRTPLTSVLGFAKIIRKKFESSIFSMIDKGDGKTLKSAAQIIENLDIIIVEGQRLTVLINDVLDIAKMEAGGIEWRIDDISLEEAIEHSIAATSSLFAQKDLVLRKDIDRELPLVQCDFDRIVQVIINLLSNAVKFTDKGYVTCSVKMLNGEIVVSVTDTGIGIDKSNHEKIFDKFKQVGDTLTNKPTGTGLGLPICKQIIEYHGGRIWVESDTGKGSKFCFALPVKSEELQTAYAF